LVAIDRSDVGYVSARMTNSGVENGCIFGDKMRSIVGSDNFSVDFNTFSATPECEEARPYMCERSSCTLCDTCVSRMFHNVSECTTTLSCFRAQADFLSPHTWHVPWTQPLPWRLCGVVHMLSDVPKDLLLCVTLNDSQPPLNAAVHLLAEWWYGAGHSPGRQRRLCGLGRVL